MQYIVDHLIPFSCEPIRLIVILFGLFLGKSPPFIVVMESLHFFFFLLFSFLFLHQVSEPFLNIVNTIVAAAGLHDWSSDVLDV
jgi:hypothetical protein